jgi:hypothetical protein
MKTRNVRKRQWRRYTWKLDKLEERNGLLRIAQCREHDCFCAAMKRNA